MVILLAAVVGGCASGGSPATTSTSGPTMTTTVTTLPPATTSTVATTTTADRAAEIEAIFQDLEERRLQALYDGDRDAFRALFANDEYRDRSMVAFDVVEFLGPPEVFVEVLDVVEDSDSCIAVLRVLHRADLGQASDRTMGVIERLDGGWGFSYNGEGWTCEGSHPLSS